MHTYNNGHHWAARYADWVIRWRWWVLLASIALAILAASGGRFVQMNNDYRVFFSEDNPQRQAFEQLQRTYTKVDNILFAVVPREGEGFSANTLAAVEQLTEQAWQLPYSLRVDSVTNFQHTRADGDSLVVQDLVENAIDMTPTERNAAKAIALNEPALAGKLVNTDGSIVGVNVTFQLPDKSMNAGPEAVAAARALMKNIENEYGVQVRATGTVMLFNAFFEASMNDMSSLIPMMYGVILLITVLLLRSVTATLATTAVIVFSILSAMGAAGHIGIQLTPPSSAAPTIIMTLAVADSIHILITLLAGMRRGLGKLEALRESIRVNLGPVFLTSATTAVGFLSMNFSDAQPFRDLGNITAIGVMAAFVYSTALLPALIALLPLRARQSQSATVGDRTIDRLANVVVHHPKGVLMAVTLVSASLLALIPLNELDDNFVTYFDESTSFRQDTDFINEHFSGIYQVQYSLNSNIENGVSHPLFLRKVHDFTQWLRQQPEVRHVNSISDTFQRLNKNLHADNPNFYRLPNDAELAAQYLLLYELSLPYGLDLNNRLNVKKSSTQLVVTLKDMPSAQLRQFAERGTRWLQQKTGLQAHGVGPAIMFAYIAERNIKNMLIGTLVAVFIIAALIMLALRSLRLGIISLLPTLLPAGLAFGVWGGLVGEINVAISMVAGMALGIVVDDTVHFLSKYQRARVELGLDNNAAIRYAFNSVGAAIVVTSIILVAGFTVLAQSSFGMNAKMAVLTAITIAFALVAVFTLLPALLSLCKERQPSHLTLSTTDSEGTDYVRNSV
ncbi:efflux RND transporter permease subunit [Gilvimarinus xylanilyticus]|uniref:MMPL family transporter n=1 Tax=Gilvimarinus xylanilyticus TaxID=2944139 RepID=A0A9X2KUQ6_9GAMM|nr:MMPL family transporter [Gilvimarinus xylanilyticus]MCP8900599.1 MMPL family transporter [Gilvimarinus xylanilyticus]